MVAPMESTSPSRCQWKPVALRVLRLHPTHAQPHRKAGARDLQRSPYDLHLRLALLQHRSAQGLLVLTPVYNCARIKLTAPGKGCKLWSMSFSMHTGGSHDQEQDNEYDTRISSARKVYSRHRDHFGTRQE